MATTRYRLQIAAIFFLLQTPCDFVIYPSVFYDRCLVTLDLSYGNQSMGCCEDNGEQRKRILQASKIVTHACIIA